MNSSSDRSHLLVAWTESWPLVSEVAFQDRVLALDDSTATERMFQELTAWLRPRARGHSLETLHLMRAQAWPADNPEGAALSSWIRELAQRYLEWNGATACVRGSWPDPEEESVDRPTMARRWRALTLILPEDLLVAAIAGGRIDHPRVSLLSDHLQKVLQRGVAETHVHLGGAVHFDTLWSSAMGALRTEAHTRLGRVPPTDRDPFQGNGSLRGALVLAATTRLLLACFLRLHADRIDFGGWLEGLVRNPAAITVLGGPLEARRALATMLDPLQEGCIPDRAGRLLQCYRRLAGWSADASPRRLQQVAARDPLHAILDRSRAPDCELARQALAYTEQGNDPLFSLVFWQYQRIRVRVFRWVTQEPGTAGLDWFGLHLERARALRSGMDLCMFESALALSQAEVNLCALEARTTPPRHWYELRGWVQAMAETTATMSDGRRPEVGLLLHLRKAAERTTARRATGKRQRLEVPRGSRYAGWYRERDEEVGAVEAALARSPELLLLLRGIDIAGREAAMPWWPFVGLVRRLRIASQRAVPLAQRRLPGIELRPFRATYHAGEDFRRLMSGLRSMHELLEFGLLQQGDRIGHGIALGVDPDFWLQNNPVTFQPREERLWDLAWELARYERGEVSAVAGRVAYVRAEMRRLGKRILGQEITVEQLMTLRLDLHAPGRLARLEYPRIVDRDPLRTTERPELLRAWLADPALWKRAREPMEVPSLPTESTVLHEVQRQLVAELCRQEITLEACPSSNLLVSDGAGMEGHHALRLRERSRQAGNGGLAVFVSVNSDDPLTFHAALAQEYEQLYAALLREGTPADDALEWIDRVRATGLRARFTLPGSRLDGALARLLPRGRMAGGTRNC